ncbi:MAG: gliding motility protein GldN, partial [Dysgonamonadaceae bacterium]|nr:gliding motility protein GldN [Dysgonamonadaceae bacterium]
MKSFYYIIVLFVACLFAQDIAAQSPRTRRPVESNSTTGLPELSVRAQAKNRDQSTDINNVIWLRMLYRNIDLKQAANAPLYFPTEPIGDRMNLYTLMFKLFIEGKLTVYEYIDGREVFSDRYKVDVERWLREKHYVYRKTGTGAAATFAVDDIDIQSGDVMAYMVKEAYYFNQATGTFGTEVL